MGVEQRMYHNATIEDAVAFALDDARLTLTRAYAANDPEIREIAKVAIAAVRRWDLEHRENLPDEVYDALIANANAITAGIHRTIELEREVKQLKAGGN